MTRNKDDHYYAEKLLKEVNRLLSFAKRLDLSDPESNEEAFYAANFCVVRIREILTSLSKDFVINRLGVNLDAFIDFRNLLVYLAFSFSFGVKNAKNVEKWQKLHRIKP